MTQTDDNTTEKVEHKPNVVFVGKQPKYNPDKDTFEMVPRPVPPEANDGGLLIPLPKVKNGEGFYSEHADRLYQFADFLPYDSPDQPETDLPLDFPLREILRSQGLQLADVKAMDRDALMRIPKIGDASADKILEYVKETQNDVE